MQFDPELVRLVLIELEHCPDWPPALVQVRGFGLDVISEVVGALGEAGYVRTTMAQYPGSWRYEAFGLTPAGRECLAAVRDDTRWRRAVDLSLGGHDGSVTVGGLLAAVRSGSGKAPERVQHPGAG